jgi:hypothetical protein
MLIVAAASVCVSTSMKSHQADLTLPMLLLPCRADASVLSAMSKALGSKLSAGDAPQDLLAGLWGLAQLGAKADGGLLSKAAGAIKGAVAELSTEQQIYAAWSFALLGQVRAQMHASRCIAAVWLSRGCCCCVHSLHQLHTPR